MKFSKKIVVSCITIITIYTAVQILLSYKLGFELSPVLTGFVYGFYGTELAACALVRIFDRKNLKSIEDDTIN